MLYVHKFQEYDLEACGDLWEDFNQANIINNTIKTHVVSSIPKIENGTFLLGSKTKLFCDFSPKSHTSCIPAQTCK